MDVLAKITELVDKDVATNTKPISMLGIFLPLLPFAFFTDGPPLDSHPVLGALALFAAMGWFGFVMSRYFRHMKKEFVPSYRKLGPVRFWALIVGTLLAILLIAAFLTWLEN